VGGRWISVLRSAEVIAGAGVVASLLFNSCVG